MAVYKAPPNLTTLQAFGLSKYLPLPDSYTEPGTTYFTTRMTPTTTTPLSADQVRLLWAFFALHVIGGHFFMPLLLVLSLLKRNLSRNYVFHNFCITWIIYSITFCLLLYAGEQVGPKPGWNLCRTQAALVYAVPILVACASCALVFQLWLDIRTPSNIVQSKTLFSVRTILLIGGPYIIAAGYLIGPSVVAITARQTITRNNSLFYCSSNLRALTVVSATSVAIIFLITLTFEVLIARMLSQRAKIQQLNDWWLASTFFIRIALFTAYLLLKVASSGVQIADPSSPFRLIIDASGPLFVFAVFGTSPALYKFDQPRPDSSSSSRTKSVQMSDTDTSIGRPLLAPTISHVA